MGHHQLSDTSWAFVVLVIIVGLFVGLIVLSAREYDRKQTRCEAVGGRLIEEGRVCVRKDVILVEE
jgi:hypothetical protein